MFYYLVCLVVLLGGCYGGDVVPLSQSTTITYQAHSYDDLGEWRQLLAKGTFSVKVDMHYVLPAQCVKQARVFNNDTRGCYLLTHDPPVDTETYYNAYDLIAFLVDPNNQALIKSLPHFYLYLAFKNSRDRFPPANITHSNNLQIEFVISLTNQIRNHGLSNVELVYDGLYINEAGEYYHWPRTYTFSAADLNNKYSCLYTNNGHCRDTAVINSMASPLPFTDPSLPLSRMCKVGYGKFKESAYPWVFWEPTDQKTILYMLDTYLNCSIEHTPGMAIAINTDPIQYQVYAGTRSGKAWNERLFQDAKWAHVVPLTTNATSITFIALHLTKDNKFAYSVATGAIDVVSSTNTFPFGAVFLGPTGYLTLPFAASPFQKLKTFVFAHLNTQYIFVSDFRGLFGLYEYSAPATLRLVATTKTINHQSHRSETVSFISSKTIVDEESNLWTEITFLQGYATFDPNVDCSLMIQLWKLRIDPKMNFQPELTPVWEPYCAAPSTKAAPFMVDSASLSVIPHLDLALIKNTTTPYCDSNTTHSGMLVLTNHKIIYGSILCFDENAESIKTCSNSACNEHGLVPFDVGTFPHVSLLSSPMRESVVLAVHGDGYCYNSDWNNKRSHPRICNSVPTSSRYVLNYNYGRLGDFAGHLFNRKGMISSCDGSIFHGVYDEGSLPSAFLTFDQKANMRMVAAHTGFPSGAVDYAGCSWPVPYDGALINGIVLPSLNFMSGDWVVPESIVSSLTPPNYDDEYVPPPAEVTLSVAMCNSCKQRIFNWQTKYSGDYDLIQAMTLKLSDMCSMGRLIAGDGTIPGCKNLVMLYVPSLSVSMLGSLLSPDNCNVLAFCNGTADILPSINNQVGAKEHTDSEDPTHNLVAPADTTQAKIPIMNTQTESISKDDPSYVMVRDAMKKLVYEAVGLSL